ncbi:hypothetical protein NSK_004594 [Nannochloropsis salina CCMP1776]|uniref:Cytochrome b561 domain-containing protein n=1 Tax=Nannochloropsis salina CCMP1776 TaxID=1027361 RepID=A0A4D9CXL0_9STRA|nr:hypothetical protein NSK_004594 [Nannochloropsis salina CCMP1776]|eukprot:TFJ84121.1 hypothetical protein NSK_004594 [Nannochloropsis salina CCMP1776]
MIIAFLFMTQLAEAIAWWASNKTNLRTNYFKVIEHGSRLWSAHRGLNTLAFILGLVGMIIILSADEFKEAMGSKERHVIYGFSMIVALFVHILFRVAYPDDKTKWVHRWFERAINLWAFFVTFTGYELANYGSNEGTDAGGEDFDNVVIIFCFWVILKFGIWVFYLILRKRGKAQKYDSVGAAEGIQLPTTNAIEVGSPPASL